MGYHILYSNNVLYYYICTWCCEGIVTGVLVQTFAMLAI